MYELKTNTAVRIAVGPLVDPTDLKTAEVALTVTGMSVEIFQMKTDGSAVVRTAFSPTASGGSNDMAHVTDDTTGMYDLELTAAQLNWLGNGRIAFYDVDGFLFHYIDISVVSAAYFDWKYGATIPAVNVTQISGDDTAADTLELFAEALDQTTGQLDAGSLHDDTITAASIATDAIAADALAATAIDEIHDEVFEGTLTFRQIVRIMLAALAGKTTGGGTATLAFRDQADTKDRISATVSAARNRTAVTLDGA